MVALLVEVLLLTSGATTLHGPAASTPVEPRAVLVLARPGTRDALLRTLPSGFELGRTYQTLPGFSGRATPEALAALASDPRVAALQSDDLGHAMTAESGPLIGATEARARFGLTGRGVTVAVLDTGVDATHPDLDGGIRGQHCFVLGGCPPSGTNEGDSAPEGNGHGTHVSGTITGDGFVAPSGIAPGAGVLVVRVFDDASVGRVSDWVAALDWILASDGGLGVRVVNMSLGTDTNFQGACDAQQPLLTAAIGQLRQAGVIVFAASGNDGVVDAIGAPACVAAAVAVGATYDDDLGREPDSNTYRCGCVDETTDAGAVACFSNSGPMLDLLAPGSRIRAAVPGGGVGEKRGTSQAVPHAAAVAALLLELDPKLSVDALEAILKSTGRPVLDGKNQRTTPLVDAVAAAREVHASFCARRTTGEPCALTWPCDGGACAKGTCFQSACVTTVPAPGPLPAAAAGCGCGAGGLGAVASLSLTLLLAATRSRRVARGRN